MVTGSHDVDSYKWTSAKAGGWMLCESMAAIVRIMVVLPISAITFDDRDLKIGNEWLQEPVDIDDFRFALHLMTGIYLGLLFCYEVSHSVSGFPLYRDIPATDSHTKPLEHRGQWSICLPRSRCFYFWVTGWFALKEAQSEYRYHQPVPKYL